MGDPGPPRPMWPNWRATAPRLPQAALSVTPGHAVRRFMTAIDFAAFVDELADVSGETILPFFRTSLAVENKSAGRLRPGDGRRSRRRKRDARADPARTSRSTASSARNTATSAPTPNMSGCSIRSTAPSPSSAGMPTWGTLIGLMRIRRAGIRHDASAVHRASASPATAARRIIAGRRARANCTCAPAPGLGDAMLVTTSPLLMNAADRAAFGRVEGAVKLSRYGGDCYATACWPPAMSISSSRPGSSRTTSSR